MMRSTQYAFAAALLCVQGCALSSVDPPPPASVELPPSVAGDSGSNADAAADAPAVPKSDSAPAEPTIDCSVLQCMPGMLHGLDCESVLSSCSSGSACAGYVSCTVACAGSDNKSNCLTMCSHGVYPDDAGRPTTASAGSQFIACACCL